MGDIIVSIDIGTSKVATLIGKIEKGNTVTILGKGFDLCNGVRKGIIIDIESTAYSIRKSLEQAENMARLKVNSAYVNIMGAHVNIINNRGSISISNDKCEITARDVEKVFFSAKDIELPNDTQIIDVIPKQYIIDKCEKIVDPIGMIGTKLELDAEIITGKIITVQNIIKSMEKANLKLDGIVVEPLATSEVTLTEEEKDRGVILLDIGGGVTNISIFEGKELMFCSAVPVGGEHITNDISIGIKVSYAEAEKLKREYEIALTSLIKNDHIITVNEVNEGRAKQIKVSEIIEIIEARTHEIFVLCRNLLEKSEMLKNYDAGIILTGSGISYVDGSTQLAKEVFNISTKVANFKNKGYITIDYVTAFGIIKFIMNQKKGNTDVGSKVKYLKKTDKNENNSLWMKILRLLGNLF